MNKDSKAGSVWKMTKAMVLTMGLMVLPGALPVQASEDPYSGYTNKLSYLLPYADGTSFASTNTKDVRISVSILGKQHTFNVDTGSRGLYVSSEELGHVTFPPNAFRGEIDLDSSGRVSYGWWTPMTLSFEVTDSKGKCQTVTSTPYILDVITLGAQMGRTASFGIDHKVKGFDGKVRLVGGGTVDATKTANGTYVVYLTHNATVNQRISYDDKSNPKGLINNVSNFGIGFDLSGAATGTGPVGDNKNQIFNPLINLDKMKDGTLVGGYIIRENGIQLGLTDKDKGYAYTTLNATGLTSAYTAPDWQTPMGQTVTKKVVNCPGSIVMDSGISSSFISAPNLKIGTKITDPMDVYLMNSGGAVGYHIDVNDKKNALNPTSVLVVKHGTDGTYSQTQPPYQAQFFNTGRNVFKAFSMLYDAENGYMGILPNSFGAKDSHVFFKAKAGGFPNPIDAP